MEKSKKRRFNEYRMQLAITQNPHLEPATQRVLWDELNNYDSLPKNDTLDVASFNALRGALGHGGSKILVK